MTTPPTEPSDDEPDISTTLLRPGYVLERFCITDLLSEGHGLGPSYQGVDLRTGRHIVIDEFIPRGEARRAGDGVTVEAIEPSGAETFQIKVDQQMDGAYWLQPFQHPHLASFQQMIRANGTAYRVNDWHPPQSLANLQSGRPKLDERTLLDLLLPLMGALAHLHHHGVLHREISPQSVYLDEDLMPVFSTFHIEREDAPDRGIVVVPGYSPLEQYSRGRDRHTPAADIYALSAVFIALLTGTSPPTAIDRLSAPTGHYTVPKANRNGFSKDLLKTLETGFSLHAKDRPQSVREWARLLPPAG